MTESLLHLHYKDKIVDVVGGEKPFFIANVHWEEGRSGVWYYSLCAISHVSCFKTSSFHL